MRCNTTVTRCGTISSSLADAIFAGIQNVLDRVKEVGKCIILCRSSLPTSESVNDQFVEPLFFSVSSSVFVCSFDDQASDSLVHISTSVLRFPAYYSIYTELQGGSQNLLGRMEDVNQRVEKLLTMDRSRLEDSPCPELG